MILEEKQNVLSIRKKIIEKEFKHMNNMQKEAVFCVNGPLLILAGAGSGKTTVLVNRIANMIKFGNAYNSSELEYEISDQDFDFMKEIVEVHKEIDNHILRKIAVNPVEPWKIMAITFTNKAAGELKERLKLMLGNKGEEVWASTFHSTCVRILRIYADRIGYIKNFTIYDTDDSKRLIKECIKELDIDDENVSEKTVLSGISRAKDRMLTPSDLSKEAQNDFSLSITSKIYKLYQSKLKNADAMDFDDLIVNTVKLFEKNNDVLEHYQDKFEYVMVDEYQDTNLVQYKLIELITRKHRNLCVVGDDDQSIYKFRGATIENIMNFENTYPDAKVIRLEQNYRSTKTILKAANSVISNNWGRKSKTLWTENDLGEKIELYTASNEQAEAKHIIDTIMDEVSKGRKYSDFAVLYRMNSQSNVIERYMVKSGIPYRIIGGHRFYERKEVKDIMSYLSVINNPNDQVRLRRIINQPKRAIGDKTVLTAIEISETIGESLFDVIGKADEFEPLKRSSKKLKSFYNLINDFIRTYQEDNIGLDELYNMVLDKTSYIDALRKERDNSESRIENIEELYNNIVTYQSENQEEASLSNFLEEVALLTDIDNYDEVSDSVVLMTMHSAKGLEFPFIFLPGFEDGIFPGSKAMYNQEEMEEERRLAYVGITRAKERLYIVNAEKRMQFGSFTKNKMSRFVNEIPEELINKKAENEWKKPSVGINLNSYGKQLKENLVNSSKHFGQVHFNNNLKEKFKPNDKVKHKVFGEGVVTSALKMGNDTLLEVNFNNVGTKKLMANFSGLIKQ